MTPRIAGFRTNTDLTADPQDRETNLRFGTADGPTTPVLFRAGGGRPPSRMVVIQSLHSERVRLASPLYVNVEESAEGTFAAISYDLELGGQGESDFEALDDLRAQVAELYETLQAEEPNLSSHLREKLAFLRTVVAGR